VKAQAEYLANLIQSYQSKGEHVISVGDFNTFEFNDGIVDSAQHYPRRGNYGQPGHRARPGDTDRFAPQWLTSPPQTQPPETYSYVYVGNAQSIDHFLVTADIASIMRTAAAHFDADFPVIFRNDSTRPEAGLRSRWHRWLHCHPAGHLHHRLADVIDLQHQPAAEHSLRLAAP